MELGEEEGTHKVTGGFLRLEMSACWDQILEICIVSIQLVWCK